MKKILGLDLGIASIGWAFIQRPDDKNVTSQIIGMGVRVIPLSSDEIDEFTKGQPVTTNQARRMSRSMRRGYYRYRIRKQALLKELESLGAKPGMDLLTKLNNVQTFELRSKAVTEKVTLQELGRALYHLNQKRGYKGNRKTDQDEDGKKVGDYIREIQDNKRRLSANNLTIGQLFFEELRENPNYMVKKRVFPRESYIDEFNRIWDRQAKEYPAILTEKRMLRMRDRIIFYQRKLKSQKGLVSKCTLEPNLRVAPKSSPLFQIGKIWEALNHVNYYDRDGHKHFLSSNQKRILFEVLNSGKKLNWTNAAKEIGLKPRDYTPDMKTAETGLEANTTMITLRNAFVKAGIDREDLLRFDLIIQERTDKGAVDTQTGEVRMEVSPDFQQEPLYQLWHEIYSIEEDDDLMRILKTKYGFTDEQAKIVGRIDFTRQGYGSKSPKVIRRILPYLMQGMFYSDACAVAGYNHFNSMTKAQRDNRKLLDELPIVKKNELRSPIVEKVLNQLIHLVNDIIKHPKYGRPDEIRIEYGRELQMDQAQRQRTFTRNNEEDRRVKEIIERLAELGIKASRKNIEKYKIYHQTDGISPYSGQKLEIGKFLSGEIADIDHIIPQSRLYDDSFQNKTIAEYFHNRNKGDLTAYEYMRSIGDTAFEQFRERIHTWYKEGKITGKKRDYFLMEPEQIPTDFIERDMRLTSFIAKEAASRLESVAREVTASSGKVTALLRRVWGWDDVLKKINMHIYKEAGLTYEHTNEDGSKETRIKQEFWTKRDDHRHHAIDALVVACTRQSYIQKLNHLNGQANTSKKALENFFSNEKPLTTNQVVDVVSGILVSFNGRKRVTTLSSNEISGKKQVSHSPRGALSEGTVYGKIQVPFLREVKISPGLDLETARQIKGKKIRNLVLDRLLENGNDPSKAFKGYKNNPIFLDEDQKQPLTVVEIPDWKEEYVVKYPLGPGFKAKDADWIVDEEVKRAVKKRLAEHGGKESQAFKDLENNPIWLNEAKGIAVKTVRCFTGLSKVVAVSKDEHGNPIGFVKPGNNHHIAIYRDSEGNLHENAVTFWDAVKRRNYDIPAIIKNPASVWDHVLHKIAPSLSENSWAELETQLPKPDWQFVMSMNINEMFIIGMTSEALEEAISTKDNKTVSQHLYRVQKLTGKQVGSNAGIYYFRRHTETRVDDKFADVRNESLSIRLGKMARFSSLGNAITSFKVIENRLGEIQLAP